MFRPSSASRLPAAALLAAAAALLGGCNLSFSNDAEAHDQWKRSYALTQPGSVDIRNPNGLVEIDAGDGDRVEVVADRTVRAATDEAAKDGLAHFDITESAAPNRIGLDAGTGTSMLLGGSRKVDFHVKVPKWAGVTIDASNGEIRVTGLSGPLRAKATNGRIKAAGLEGPATATTTNGVIALDFAKVGDGDITCETTNGEVVVTIPGDAKARISARVTNGAIRHSGLNLTIAEESRRVLDASVGGGGPTVRLTATNGALTINGRK